jgi:hypothetical protein
VKAFQHSAVSFQLKAVGGPGEILKDTNFGEAV